MFQLPLVVFFRYMGSGDNGYIITITYLLIMINALDTISDNYLVTFPYSSYIPWAGLKL